MAAKIVAEDCYSKYECQKAISLYMIILHNFRGVVDTHLPVIKKIMLAKLGHHDSTAIPLTWIVILEILVLALFNNP